MLDLSVCQRERTRAKYYPSWPIVWDEDSLITPVSAVFSSLRITDSIFNISANVGNDTVNSIATCKLVSSTFQPTPSNWPEQNRPEWSYFLNDCLYALSKHGSSFTWVNGLTTVLYMAAIFFLLVMGYSYEKQSILPNVYENLSKVENCELENDFCQILSRQNVNMDLTGSYPATTLCFMIHVTSMLCGNPLLILSCLERLQNFRSSNLNSSGETSYVRFVDQRYCGTGCVYYKTMVDYPTASNFMAFICSLRMFGSSYSFVHDADGHLMFRRCSVKAAFNVKCLKKDEFGIGW